MLRPALRSASSGEAKRNECGLHAWRNTNDSGAKQSRDADPCAGGQPPGGNAGKPGATPGKSAEKKEPEGPKPITRPTKPGTPPKPEELKIRPGKDGKVRLDFNGQPWDGVLNWLADISGMSLDWQELPGDPLNLSTQQSYTVPEVRDLINRHLLARGYTLIRQGEMMTVVNVKKLDASLVPRVQPDELARRDPHEFVKVCFTLDWFLAETAGRELQALKSPNGKLTAMPETNRLEAMDAVTNLRDMYAVLKSEQSDESQQRLVRPFQLKYTRAAEVRDQLITLLGEDSAHGAPGPQQPQNPQQAQQQAMMMARMQASGGQPKPGGQPGQPGQTPGGAAAKTFTLVADERENRIIATAKPDKMAIIAMAIEAIDVPSDVSPSLQATMNRTHRYTITGVDPKLVVKTLQQVGNLSPTTRLEVDEKNKAIIAVASLADQVTINAVVEKLSGSERHFEPIRLHRLAADSVAGSILFMMGIEPKKKKERPSYFSYFGPQPTQTEKSNEFRVDADVEHNILLLYANDVELKEVNDLLVKLGEIPPKGGNPATRRVIEAGDPQETREMLDRIRRAWPSLAPDVPLILPDTTTKKQDTEPAPSKEKPHDESPLPPAKTAQRAPDGALIHLAELRRDVVAEAATAETGKEPAKAETAAADASKSKPPVKITIGPDGKLVISSDDPEALDLLEELADQLTPQRKDYRVFPLKYASAYTVSLNLEDFFKEDKKDNKRVPWYWFDSGSQDDESDDRRLSKRPKLKFISDYDSNSILVQGADASQMKTVEELVKIYDQPPPTDTQSVRKTQTIHLKYAKAKIVEEAIKGVYRDLLSANDKALADSSNRRQTERTVIYDWGGGGDGDKGEQKVPKFKGLLSIGVDETSNSLVVSAPAFLFDHVSKMIQELDDAAANNNTVRVVKVGSGVSATRLHEILEAVSNGRSAGSVTTSAESTKEGSKTPKNGKKQGGKNGGKSEASSSTD